MEKTSQHLFVLILCGGGGTRLWPLSRENFPKQFVRLFHDKSLFQLTLERAKKLTSPSRIFISTNSRYVKEIKSEASGIPAENIIAEPVRRDTAMAMGIGALYIYHRDPEAVIINLASDHLISPDAALVKDVALAAESARRHAALVTIGIQPAYPHTGLGHIKAVHPLDKSNPAVLKGEQFVEKPPLDLAEKFTKSGKYYWNANLYVWQAKVFLDLLKKHSPKTTAFFPKLLVSLGTDSEKEVLQQAFQMAPSISVDYAVSEKLPRFICVPASFSWTDVGYWDVVWANLPKDHLGNVITGPHGRAEHIGIDSQNNLVFLDKKLIATVGLKDMLIIDTPDALLICPKDEAQWVKKVVQALKDAQLSDYL